MTHTNTLPIHMFAKPVLYVLCYRTWGGGGRHVITQGTHTHTHTKHTNGGTSCTRKHCCHGPALEVTTIFGVCSAPSCSFMWLFSAKTGSTQRGPMGMQCFPSYLAWGVHQGGAAVLPSLKTSIRTHNSMHTV